MHNSGLQFGNRVEIVHESKNRAAESQNSIVEEQKSKNLPPKRQTNERSIEIPIPHQQSQLTQSQKQHQNKLTQRLEQLTYLRTELGYQPQQ